MNCILYKGTYLNHRTITEKEGWKIIELSKGMKRFVYSGDRLTFWIKENELVGQSKANRYYDHYEIKEV